MQLGLLVPLGAIIALVAAFPSATLTLLGHEYLGLKREVVLIAISGALGTLTGAAYALAAARGVVTSPWVAVPMALLVQVGLVATLPMSTVAGVLWLGVLSNLVLWLVYSLNFSFVATSRA